MRLIDADALESYIESDESGLMSAREFERDYIECINEMPTVFDLESITTKLKENEQDMLNAIEEDMASEPYVMFANGLKQLIKDYTKEQIDIIKSSIE